MCCFRFFRPDSGEQHGHHSAGVSAEGIAAVGNTVVVNDCPLADGVDLGDFVIRKVSGDLTATLSFVYQLVEHAVIIAVLVHQMPVPFRDYLCGLQRRKELYRDLFFNPLMYTNTEGN